jgi:hypothetical protein
MNVMKNQEELMKIAVVGISYVGKGFYQNGLLHKKGKEVMI